MYNKLAYCIYFLGIEIYVKEIPISTHLCHYLKVF